MSMHYARGKYAVVFTRQKLSETSNGNAQFVLSFKPYKIENPSTGEWEDLIVEPFERSAFLSITDKSVKYTQEKLNKLGFQISAWEQLDQDDPNCCSLIGQTAVMECKEDTYQGQQKERWDVPGSSDGVEMKPLPQEKLSRLNALFGRNLPGQGKAPIPVPANSNGKAPSPVVPPPIPAQEAREVTKEDDMPF